MTNRLLINIDVPDLQAGIAFYENGLGFEPQRRLFDGTVAEMAVDDLRIYLIERAASSPPFVQAATTRNYADHWTPVHFDLVTDEIEQAVERAVLAGARPTAPAAQHDWGKLTAMRDPFGHGFCFVEFSEAGYSAVSAGRL